MQSILFCFLFFTLLIPSAMAQGGSGSTAIVSPEVANDGRVTFRLRAPKASSVTVSGDFGAESAMQKGEDGVWSATIGPLPPEEYIYYYLLDNVRLLDPYNARVKVGYVT